VEEVFQEAAAEEAAEAAVAPADHFLCKERGERSLIMLEQKLAVVVNPASANGSTGKHWPEIADALKREGLSFTHTLTEAPGHATEITASYLKEGYDLILSVGGDGTANEVVNGFFKAGFPGNQNAAVGFLSTGTGRDLGRTIGTPKDTVGAVRHILNAPLRQVDVGKITFINSDGDKELRYFINVAGLGLDGDTCDRVNRTSKALGGFISFLWGTVVSLALYKNKNMAITVDGELICDEPVTIIVAGNGRYFGGGMCVAPHAEIDDGLFDIIILRNLSKLNLLYNLPKVYSGSHLNHPRITSLRGKKITVTSSGDALLELDGEQTGQAPVEIEILPGAITIKG
jgi:diacylglycerol kinase (ATP)